MGWNEISWYSLAELKITNYYEESKYLDNDPKHAPYLNTLIQPEYIPFYINSKCIIDEPIETPDKLKTYIQSFKLPYTIYFTTTKKAGEKTAGKDKADETTRAAAAEGAKRLAAERVATAEETERVATAEETERLAAEETKD